MIIETFKFIACTAVGLAIGLGIGHVAIFIIDTFAK